jgi:hypothetical protein
MITFLQGDVTKPQIVHEDGCIVAHIVNDVNKFGSGIAAAMAKNFPIVKKKYHEWANQGFFHNDDLDMFSPFQLGYNQFLDVQYGDRSIWIVNMLAQHGLKSKNNPVPFQGLALQGCLEQINEFMGQCDHSVGLHMGKIGSMRGGGHWPDILDRIQMILPTRSVYIYEFDENV